MRVVVLIMTLMLAGCGTNRELGNAFSGAVDAFAAGVDTEQQLVVDLQKDFRRKSEQFWNACARERLFFIRDFYPPSLGQPKSGKYAGIARTPVLHFAAAYASYIAEREKFLARRADFAGLLDAIVDANQKIVDQVDVLGSIANIGTAAGTLRQQGETIRKNFGQT